MTKWRLLPLIEAPGAMQMAIDRWLLGQHRQGLAPPTLRFYTWSPAAISLGYHQRDYPPFWKDLTWQGQPLEIVRRPTGGRGVLHQGDLTYSLVISGIPGRRVEVYEKICQFLIQGWRSLGVELHYGSAPQGRDRNPNCFATATRADLLDAGGNKVIGSAQWRQGHAILQHGSMLLWPDRGLFERVFGEFTNFSSLLGHNGLTCSSPQEKSLVLDKAIAALTAAAQDCFEVDLVCQPLSSAEWQALEQLSWVVPNVFQNL